MSSDHTNGSLPRTRATAPPGMGLVPAPSVDDFAAMLALNQTNLRAVVEELDRPNPDPYVCRAIALMHALPDALLSAWLDGGTQAAMRVIHDHDARMAAAREQAKAGVPS